MVEGSGVIVEAVACDGACTVDTNGVGNGNGNSNDNGNGNDKDPGNDTSTGRWFAQIIKLATCSAAADML